MYVVRQASGLKHARDFRANYFMSICVMILWAEIYLHLKTIGVTVNIMCFVEMTIILLTWPLLSSWWFNTVFSQDMFYRRVKSVEKLEFFLVCFFCIFLVRLLPVRLLPEKWGINVMQVLGPTLPPPSVQVCRAQLRVSRCCTAAPCCSERGNAYRLNNSAY